MSSATPDPLNDPLWRLRGALYGLAFDVRMMRDTPNLDMASALRFLEDELVRFAREDISLDEAISGYGG